MIDYSENTLTFDCPECKNTMTIGFNDDFEPNEHPNFKFCCLSCGQQFIITNWAPVWIIRDLSQEKNDAEYIHSRTALSA